jgi:hypothetical protein
MRSEWAGLSIDASVGGASYERYRWRIQTEIGIAS